MTARRASKRKPNAQGARKAAAIASLPGVVVRGRIGPRYAEILSRDALAFLAALHRRFDGKRRDLLAARAERQSASTPANCRISCRKPGTSARATLARGADSGRSHRPARGNHRPGRPQDDHQCAQFRRQRYMADFEDANSPTWANNHGGPDQPQGPLARSKSTSPMRDRKALRARSEAGGADRAPARLASAGSASDGGRRAVSGALFDFGLYFFHNAKAQLAQGSGPYFYLPKLESHHEARLWNEVFVFAQETAGHPNGTSRRRC